MANLGITVEMCLEGCKKVLTCFERRHNVILVPYYHINSPLFLLALDPCLDRAEATQLTLDRDQYLLFRVFYTKKNIGLIQAHNHIFHGSIRKHPFSYSFPYSFSLFFPYPISIIPSPIVLQKVYISPKIRP